MGTYIYVSSPTTVRMVCDNITTFHYISEFDILKFENNCELFKTLDFDPTTYFENIQIDRKIVGPNFDALNKNNWTQFLKIESQLIESQNLTENGSGTSFFGSIKNSIVNSILKPIEYTMNIYTALIYAGYAIILIFTCCVISLIATWCKRIKNIAK